MPNNHEIQVYNTVKEDINDWQLYMNYRYLKNNIMTMIANFNIDILDLYHLLKK